MNKCSKCNEEFEFTNPIFLDYKEDKHHIVFVSCYECGNKNKNKNSQYELTIK